MVSCIGSRRYLRREAARLEGSKQTRRGGGEVLSFKKESGGLAIL